MSELISGKAAKLAWANGENIELCYKQHEGENTWFLLLSTDPLSTFDRDDFLFRLKPKTITLNGIEVPCNKSKHDKDDVVWVINTVCENWYDWTYGSSCDPNTLYWKSEDEIKQVIAALKKIFVINN